MRSIVILLFASLALPQFTHAQRDTELWLSGGVKYSHTKKLDFAGEMNVRMQPDALNTFFSEFTAKYQVTKWFKPSLDYRLVWKRNKFGNYPFSQRININANFGTDWNRFELGLRARAQANLTHTKSTESSFSDLAPGIRIKPEILYDINNSILSPVVSAEFFFNNDRDLGVVMNKIRFSAGIDFETLGPYNVGLKYMYGFSRYSPKYEHILAFSFTRKYKGEAAKKKKNKK